METQKKHRLHPILAAAVMFGGLFACILAVKLSSAV